MQPFNPMQPYEPDVFEYDDELSEGEISEKIILASEDDPSSMRVVKVIGTRPKNIPAEEWAHFADEEDEEDA